MVQVKLAALNAFSYFLLTCDIRACALGRIGPAVTLNLIIGAVSFYVLKGVQATDGFVSMLAYAIGGAAGVALGIVFTKRWFGA